MRSVRTFAGALFLTVAFIFSVLALGAKGLSDFVAGRDLLE